MRRSTTRCGQAITAPTRSATATIAATATLPATSRSWAADHRSTPAAPSAAPTRVPIQRTRLLGLNRRKLGVFTGRKCGNPYVARQWSPQIERRILSEDVIGRHSPYERGGQGRL